MKALGALGLKLKLAMNRNSEKKKEGVKGINSLLGTMYTISPEVDPYINYLGDIFSRSDDDHRLSIKKWYFASVAIMGVYALVAYFAISHDAFLQALGLTLALLVLDLTLLLVKRGPCTWTAGRYVFLTFCGRTFLSLWAGPWWIVGVGLAYFAYGASLGQEIINQRMKTLSSSRAGAVAYFGKSLMSEKRRYDVSASPEFALGFLSFLFLVVLLGYVFSVDADDMPLVPTLGQQWEVWVFGVFTFVVVIIASVFGMAQRAMLLDAQQLLNSKMYFIFESVSVPVQFLALGFLLEVMSGFLLYAMVQSTFVLIASMFFPLILGSGYRVYAQWKINECDLLEPKIKRISDENDEDNDKVDEEESGEADALRAVFGGGGGFSFGSGDGDDSRDISMPILPMSAFMGSGKEEDAAEDETPQKEEDEKEETNHEKESSKGQGGKFKMLPKLKALLMKILGKLLRWKNSDDPLAVSPSEAYFKGMLTNADYGTIHALVGHILLVFLFGQLVSVTEEPKWVGNVIWFVHFYFLLSTYPTVQYLQTYKITRANVKAQIFAFFFGIVGLTLIFKDAVGFDVTSEYFFYLLFSLFVYPTCLTFAAAVYVWKDSNYKKSKFVNRAIPATLGLFAVYIALLFVFSANSILALTLTLFWCFAVGTIKTLEAWADHEFYLPVEHQKRITFILTCVAIGFVVYGLFFDDSSYFFASQLRFCA